MEPSNPTALEYAWGLVAALTGALWGLLTMRIGRAERATDKAFERLDAHTASDQKRFDDMQKQIQEKSLLFLLLSLLYL